MGITITTLIENSMSEHKALIAEHGLAFHIDTGTARILFDCGSGPAILHNARKLRVDLARLDLVAISHGHYDHGGGFKDVAAVSGVKRLVTGDGFFIPKYGMNGLRATFLGVDLEPNYLASHAITHTVCGDMLELADGCWAVGNFDRDEAMETIPERFTLRRDGVFVPDRFAEEIALAIRLGDKLAVLVGCSHPGILNILRTIRRRIDLPIGGVWGGTHLVEADAPRLAATLAEFKRMGIRRIGLSHCSGDRMLELVAADPDVDAVRLRTGDSLFLTESDL